MEVTVSKRLEFEAAHRLPRHKGKCRDIHGHHWEIELACSGPVNKETGMVVDFGEFKSLRDWVDEKFDHKNLNDFMETPTAENIAAYILGEFTLWCTSRGLDWKYIKVWESKDSCASISNG
jgi:6-pyruvoyltetrahydropterin/6-carboxytetrahydropterin synthase